MAISFNDFPPLPWPLIALGETPPPGSWEAVEQGCTCPIDDNEYGSGYYGQPDVFVLTKGCPLHIELYEKTLAEIAADLSTRLIEDTP